jgi:2-haloacid dehalogenase
MVRRMNRRDLLWFAGLSACAGRAVMPRRARIRAICFDLFTLFDPRGVVETASEVFGERAQELCAAWRSRQFEYGFLRAAAGQYVDFRTVTSDALTWAARAQGVRVSSVQREQLIESYSTLRAWPDTRERLTSFKQQGLLMAPLANYSPVMLEGLMKHSGLREFFDTLISTDAARTFKPDPRAYALGPERLGLARDEIVFAAFGGWDAAGARWFGFPTFWVNRLGVTTEELQPGPHQSGPDLAALEQFVRS